MPIRLADTLAPMGDFPAVMAKDTYIVKGNNKEKSLQAMYEDGELGGGGGSVKVSKLQKVFVDNTPPDEFEDIFAIKDIIDELVTENDISGTYTFIERTLTIENVAPDDTPLIFRINRENNQTIIENKLKPGGIVTIPFTTSLDWKFNCTGYYNICVVVSVI